MARTNRKVKKRGPSFGLPTGLVLIAERGGAGADGWRTMVVTENPAGMMCGRLAGVPSDATAEEVKRAGVEWVRWMARRSHGQEVVAIWDPQRELRSWTAAIVVAVRRSQSGPVAIPGSDPDPDPDSDSDSDSGQGPAGGYGD